ncbi:uncharacterized protein TRAVEDRAFT_57635 [Trametes versicolor FP-101664 SS1]|uniref:uncharacterized protein n=1 Tax=Trametes versicolor (strain FP-101664) TaxID=717944 RepID=UPI0004621D27|nr:uncharacterized protein TRAVEDRAFT_57635 [Trametes versicolor FP-101664 SS1]EIW60355.1 hypothetical protein TRAVEDRAFT_57635 [Trametes versicolor FP-101664 SS1]
MAGGPGEYEVETIVRAKVAKKKGRKSWLYCVKWKGYGTEDNTWEPVDSFVGGSEHFIEFFWNRVNTDGRDYQSIREFAVDEEFFPSGPPRRKKAKKTEDPEDVIEIPSSPSPAANADSENEVRSIIDDDEPVITTTTRNKRRRSSGAADAEPSPSKRPKRGRPPGKRASEVEVEEASKTLTRKRSVPEIPRTNRGRAPVAEASTSSPQKPSIPRTRGRKAPPAPRASSSSPDELSFLPTTNGKSRASPAKRNTAAGSRVEAAIDVDAPHEGSASEDAAEASAMIVDDDESEALTFGTPSLLAPEPGPSTALPAHRSRAANPRVKVMDDHNLTESGGALSVKARFMRRTAGASTVESTASSPARPGRVPKGKAGPGRSSSGLVVGGTRLVAQKGKLTSVKSAAGAAKSSASQRVSAVEQNGDDGPLFDSTDAEEVPGLGQLDDAPKPPPSGKELLKQAGLDATAANDLPDFEEDAEGEDDVEFIENPSQPQGPLSPNGQAAGEGTSGVAAPEEAPKLPEKAPIVLEARPLTFASRVTSAWSQSTIFGPLALGLSPTRKAVQEEQNGSSSPKRYTLNLNLDSAVSLPITLKDTHADVTFLEKIDTNARNPTGKFYKDENSIALVNTLKPCKSYARVALSDGATDEQKKHFERFVSRMLAGELFIQMNHFEPLVMCASENSVLGQKLAVPAPLLGLAGTVLVVHVSIEDHCAYADAADRADGARW